MGALRRGLGNAAAIGLIVAASRMAFAGEIESSLRPGDRLEPFQVKDCTGPAAGKTLCYYCRYGLRPAAALFVREWSAEVVQLLVQIEREAELRREARLGTFVVYLGNDTQAVESELKSLAAEQKIIRTPLTIYRDAPEKIGQLFGLPPGARVALLTWRNGEIQTTRLYNDARLTDEEIARALQAVRNVAP